MTRRCEPRSAWGQVRAGAAVVGASSHPRNSQRGENRSSVCRVGLAERPSSGTRHGWGQSGEVAAVRGQCRERDAWITAAGGAQAPAGPSPKDLDLRGPGEQGLPGSRSPMRGQTSSHRDLLLQGPPSYQPGAEGPHSAPTPGTLCSI